MNNSLELAIHVKRTSLAFHITHDVYYSNERDSKFGRINADTGVYGG